MILYYGSLNVFYPAPTLFHLATLLIFPEERMTLFKPDGRKILSNVLARLV